MGRWWRSGGCVGGWGGQGEGLRQFRENSNYATASNCRYEEPSAHTLVVMCVTRGLEEAEWVVLRHAFEACDLWCCRRFTYSDV